MSEKTEQATPRKLRKAREEGNIAHSKDLTQAVLMSALFGYMLVGPGSGISDRFVQMMMRPLTVLNQDFDKALSSLFSSLAMDFVLIVGPFVLIVICVGLFIEMLQTGMLFTFKAFGPFGKKLNVANNVKQIFSVKSVVELLKSIVKITIISTAVYAVIRASLPALVTIPAHGLEAVSVLVALLVKQLIIYATGAQAVISVADAAWQKRKYLFDLKMTKDEVKREYKDDEGDPEFRQHRRRQHRELLEEEPAVKSTRDASALIVNPTHVAIAILYQEGVTLLPVVLAKGTDVLAGRMRAKAEALNIPILEDVPLAWSLLEHATLHQYIPDDLVLPVAQALRLIRELFPNPDAEHSEEIH